MHQRLILGALLMGPIAAHTAEPSVQELSAQLDSVKAELAEQKALLRALLRERADERAAMPAAVPIDALAAARGTGATPSGVAAGAVAATSPRGHDTLAAIDRHKQASVGAPDGNIDLTVTTVDTGTADATAEDGADRVVDAKAAGGLRGMAVGGAYGMAAGGADDPPTRASFAHAAAIKAGDATAVKAAAAQAALAAVTKAVVADAALAARGGASPPAGAGTAATAPGSGPAVGQRPAQANRPPEVAPLFEQPGVLTPRHTFVLEPSLQYGYASSNRVALVGYTVIPALLIGLVDVREIKRSTTTAALSLRTGLSNRLEVEARVPWVYRSDSAVSREIFTGTASDRVFDTSGKAIGDAELGMRYQLNQGGADRAYYIGGLRLKSRTGRDPFEVVTDCMQRCTGPNATGTGLPLSLPTGSGFYSVQPSLTMLFPSDPAVFFGSVSYLHNLKRSNVSRTVLAGEREALGDIKPGDIIGFNFGMGMGLNDKASFSLGYDHSS
ncbi:MAG: hypothetical protein ACLGI6_19195, partial [Gammaproteobacteria bacterium]